MQSSPMRVPSTAAKNRFVSLSAHAKREPIFVEKAGQLDTIIISAEHYYALRTKNAKLSLAVRKKKFEAEFGGWIAAENARFKVNGIPGNNKLQESSGALRARMQSDPIRRTIASTEVPVSVSASLTSKADKP